MDERYGKDLGYEHSEYDKVKNVVNREADV